MNPKQDLKASGCVYLSPKPPAPVAPLASKPMPGPLPCLCPALAHTDPIKQEMASQPLCHTFPFETVLHLPPVLLQLLRAPQRAWRKGTLSSCQKEDKGWAVPSGPSVPTGSLWLLSLGLQGLRSLPGAVWRLAQPHPGLLFLPRLEATAFS